MTKDKNFEFKNLCNAECVEDQNPKNSGFCNKHKFYQDKPKASRGQFSPWLAIIGPDEPTSSNGRRMPKLFWSLYPNPAFKRALWELCLEFKGKTNET